MLGSMIRRHAQERPPVPPCLPFHYLSPKKLLPVGRAPCSLCFSISTKRPYIIITTKLHYIHLPPSNMIVMNTALPSWCNMGWITMTFKSIEKENQGLEKKDKKLDRFWVSHPLQTIGFHTPYTRLGFTPLTPLSRSQSQEF